MNFIDEIINEMPKNLNDLEKARYLYLKISLILNFSTKFNNTTEKEYGKMMYIDKPNIDEIEKNQIICRWWAAIYSEALNKVGIKNEIMNMGHQFVAFNYNGKIWQADATYGGDERNKYTDLSRVKYGDETERFGVSFSQNISKPNISINHYDPDMALLEIIDKKFDFYQIRKNKYKEINTKLNNLSNSTLSVKEKLEYIFDSVGTLENGYYESKDFIKNLEDNYLNNEELNCISATELKRTNMDGEVDIIQCIYVKDNEQYSYYLLTPNYPIIKVNSKDLIKLSILGYGIGDKKIPNVNYPKKFKVGKKCLNIYNFKLMKNFIPQNIVNYNEEQIDMIR